MSKSSDLLGLIIDTSLVPTDDDPGFDGKGYTALITPKDNNPADEDEDDSAFKGLLDSGLSQEEAQETVDFMKPLSEEERDILEETPGLEGLTRVDDAEHDRWLGQKAHEGHNAIDRALEDAVYGDNNMAHDEEGMERNDTDSGWGLRSAFRKVGRGLKKGLTTYNPAYRIAKKGFDMTARRFLPNRDAQKARMVKSLYRRLWFEHANWLALQDQKAGLALKPRAQYEQVSRLWAKGEIAKQGLPTALAVDTSSGSDAMGAWWNPLSWFGAQSQTVMVNTQDKRSATGPDGQPVQSPDGMMDPNAPPYDPSTDPSTSSPADPSASAPADPSMYPPPDATSQGEPHMKGWNHVRNLTGKPDITQGEDSLGAFAAQILGGGTPPQPAKDNPHVDRIVQAIVLKLKANKPISPSELGLLSSAAKEGNVHAQKVLVVLESRGVAVSGDESGLDPWMYKLSPSYWFASKQKKEFITAEKKNWIENAKLQKQLAKQKDVLDEAEKAAQAAQAVAAAKQQTADTEAQLKVIEASLKGSMSGTFVGHEKIMPIADVVARALEKAGKKEEAGRLYGKIRAGQPLSKDEIKQARQIANLIGRMKVVHGDLVSESEETLAMHGAFIGACVLGGIGAAQEQNAKQSSFADAMGKKIASGQSLTTAERNGLARVLGDQDRLHRFTASLVSGRAFVGCPQGKTWTRGAFVGAAKAMSDADRKMLGTIVKLAKLGNPRAQKALAELKKSGEIMGGDVMGFGIKKFFHYATAPIWLPAAGVYKGSQALFGSKKGGGSPEQIRLAQMRAASQRAKAATARAAAADAQTAAEQRAQQAIADAADAEADAADAEAAAKEEKMKTAEAEANPDSIPSASGSSGTFVGATDAELEQLMQKATTPGSGVKPQHVKILAKANEQSPAGTKIRAGANLYARSQSRNPKIRMPADRSIKIMAAKAKKGDPQAQRDLNAVKAGRIAVRTKSTLTPKQYAASEKKWSRHFVKEEAKAQKKKAALAAREARRTRVIAFQKRYEARIANKLAEGSRKRELRKLAIVERKAAKGNPKARAFVAKRVAASKQGDKKALAQVRGMQLGKAVRTTVTTRRERQNMRFAQAMAKRLRKNDPKAIRQYLVWKDAAAKGNPNAIRCLQRLALAGAVISTIATGVVVLPKVLAKKDRKAKAKSLKPGSPERASAQQQVAQAKARAKSGTGTREELTSAAKTAHQLGDKNSAGQLAQAASKAPSSTERLKKVGNTVAAAQSGNPAAQAQLDSALEGAKEGRVDDIQTLGHVMAAKTIDSANKGEPLSPTMVDALNLQARARSGDPVAQETLARVSEAATQPNPAPEAVLAATGAVAAATLATALANKPKARQELMAMANPPIPAGEKTSAEAEVAQIVAKANEGTVTPEEGARGVELAQRLGKPKLAAEISAKSPPHDESWGVDLSSLPDVPLPPIRGAKELIKESLKALTLTTRDPIANWREGVAARSKDAPAASPAEPVTSSGWSPFSLFTRPSKAALAATFIPGAAPILAATAAATAASHAISSAANKGRHAQPASSPAPSADAPIPGVAKAATATAGSSVGASDGFKDLVANALQSKKMSKSDFNKAVNSSVGPEASPAVKKAVGEQTLKFLKDRNVTVGGAFVGASDASLGAFVGAFVGKSDEFKQLIIAALKAKMMSRDDFNKAVAAHVKPDASPAEKTAAGEKMLSFLAAKKVQIS